MKRGLLDLPMETLHNILVETEPLDLGSLLRSCKDLHSFIKDNTILYRDIYLRNWDPPPKTQNSAIDWQKYVQKYARLQKLLDPATSREDKLENFAFVCKTVDDFVKMASPEPNCSKNLAELTKHFSKSSNLLTFPCQSGIYVRARQPHMDLRVRGLRVRGGLHRVPCHEKQLSAKLHVLLGAPLTKEWDPDSRIYPYACSKVYDLRNYLDQNRWGPWQDDGSMEVDWEKLEAIMAVLSHNMRLSCDCLRSMNQPTWMKPFSGAMPHSFRHLSDTNLHAAVPHAFLAKLIHETRSILPRTPDIPALDPALDPYGVTGTWMRIVCFLDYTELFAYNFADLDTLRPSTEPRPPLSTTEATRLIVMTYVATHVEPPGPEDGQDLPVVHFLGSSRALRSAWDPNAQATLRGTVRQTKDGEICWTTFSSYHGEERWRSEGIQIGGLRSARGVLGTWFDVNYDPHGPAGPTCFWKVREDIEEDGEFDPNAPEEEDVLEDEDDEDFNSENETHSSEDEEEEEGEEENSPESETT